MIGLILVTHGNLAGEFVNAMEHVVGRQEAIATVCIGPADDMEKRRAEITEAIAAVDSGKGVIILTDLFGGTPSNLAISLMEAGRVEVIAGTKSSHADPVGRGARQDRSARRRHGRPRCGRTYITVASEFLEDDRAGSSPMAPTGRDTP